MESNQNNNQYPGSIPNNQQQPQMHSYDVNQQQQQQQMMVMMPPDPMSSQPQQYDQNMNQQAMQPNLIIHSNANGAGEIFPDPDRPEL
jgi:hypothetical protein